MSSIASCFKLTRISREHPEANEVFVTGTFDDWGKTEKLDRKGDFFGKDVQLPNKDKILYKVCRNCILVFLISQPNRVASSTFEPRGLDGGIKLPARRLSSLALPSHLKSWRAHGRSSCQGH